MPLGKQMYKGNIDKQVHLLSQLYLQKQTELK